MRRFFIVMGILLSFAAPAFITSAAQAQIICISNVTAPPDIPDYDQPPIPAPDYMWIPGYWASGPNGYFWVPGTWTLPPASGLLWTPGYWSWRDGIYVWNAGYWGPRVGFYGGINYGFGYDGVGYQGGRWDNGVFLYNRAVNNFGAVVIAHVFDRPVVVAPGLRVSFNGGAGGIAARATAEEELAAREQHIAALPAQFAHERVASANRALLASENRGRPAIAATVRPGEFTGRGVVAAREPVTIPLGRPGAVEVSPRPLEPRVLPREERRDERPAERPLPPSAAVPPKPLPPEVRPRELEPRPPVTGERPLPREEIERRPPPPPTAAVKPAPLPPPPHPAPPPQAAVRPAPPPPPPHPAAPAAARPECPPGKHLADVGGHPVCK